MLQSTSPPCSKCCSQHPHPTQSAAVNIPTLLKVLQSASPPYSKCCCQHPHPTQSTAVNIPTPGKRNLSKFPMELLLYLPLPQFPGQNTDRCSLCDNIFLYWIFWDSVYIPVKWGRSILSCHGGPLWNDTPGQYDNWRPLAFWGLPRRMKYYKWKHVLLTKLNLMFQDWWCL